MGYAFWDNTKLELDFGFVIMECRLGPKLSHSALRQSTLLRLGLLRNLSEWPIRTDFRLTAQFARLVNCIFVPKREVYSHIS